MQAEYLVRQSALIPQEVLNKKIVIVGAGAIGSFTTLTLAKMGFNNIHVWDFDTVSTENMNCQFFPIESIGMPKTLALKQMVVMFTGTEINIRNGGKVNDCVLLRGDILISAVDCMDVRKTILDQCGCTHLVDARMGAEYIMMYSVNMLDLKEVANYKKSLYTNDDSEQERCTAKSTMYTVNLIAGLIGKTVKDIVTEGSKRITGLDWSVKENSALWFSGKNKLTL